MSRIRTIKPELFSSTSAKGLTLGARWLFAALFTEADDEGRMLASARKIAGNVFPDDEDITEQNVAEWIDELERKGMVLRYVVEGIRYLWVVNFRKHQRISHPTPSRLPPPPEVLAKVSGEPVEPLGKDLGSGKGSGSGRGSEAAAPPEPPVNRGRQNPDAPPPLRGQRLNGVGVGFMENPADFPKTVEELLEKHGAELAKDFPQLDGKSPRPSLLDAVRSKWPWYLKARDAYGGGHTNAMGVLRTDLAKVARDHAFSWERDRQTVTTSTAVATTKTKVLKPLEGPHPGEAPDAPTPDEVRALLTSTTTKLTRAGPGGGANGSGKAATTGG